MTGPQRVLVVEDEEKIAQVLVDYLRSSGFAPTWLADGHAVAPFVRSTAPDIVLLDLMLPGIDGVVICRDLRTFSTVPIIMITARVEEIDRLLGLDAGADDYVCKPFSPREVIARVTAVLRRTARAADPATVPRLAIDDERFEARLDGKPLDLTPVEFRLLRTLATQARRIFSRSQLLDSLYEDHRIVSDRTVDSHVKNLRRKLQDAVPGEEFVQSVYGVGYKLDI